MGAGRRLLAAVALPLSFSGGAVATPAIGRDLHGGTVAMNWITNAFMLAFGSFLMAAGALADQFGRKRLFAIGVGGFTLMSGALAFAPSMLAVDLLRAAQGNRGGRGARGRHGRARAGVRRRGARAHSACSARPSASSRVRAGARRRADRAIRLARDLRDGRGGRRAVARIRAAAHARVARPACDETDWPGTAAFTTALTLFTFGVIEAPARGWSARW